VLISKENGVPGHSDVVLRSAAWSHNQTPTWLFADAPHMDGTATLARQPTCVSQMGMSPDSISLP